MHTHTYLFSGCLLSGFSKYILNKAKNSFLFLNKNGQIIEFLKFAIKLSTRFCLIKNFVA